jgi:hypothetical protein
MLTTSVEAENKERTLSINVDMFIPFLEPEQAGSQTADRVDQPGCDE